VLHWDRLLVWDDVLLPELVADAPFDWVLLPAVFDGLPPLSAKAAAPPHRDSAATVATVA
jgi:hypothetical protein